MRSLNSEQLQVSWITPNDMSMKETPRRITTVKSSLKLNIHGSAGKKDGVRVGRRYSIRPPSPFLLQASGQIFKGTVSRDGYFFGKSNQYLNSLLWLVDVLYSADLSFVSRKKRNKQKLTCPIGIGGFRYFTESQAGSLIHFQSNRHFRVFEAGYWKDFQN